MKNNKLFHHIAVFPFHVRPGSPQPCGETPMLLLADVAVVVPYVAVGRLQRSPLD